MLNKWGKKFAGKIVNYLYEWEDIYITFDKEKKQLKFWLGTDFKEIETKLSNQLKNCDVEIIRDIIFNDTTGELYEVVNNYFWKDKIEICNLDLNTLLDWKQENKNELYDPKKFFNDVIIQKISAVINTKTIKIIEVSNSWN